MPRDGSKTRERILDRASRVFNRRGYWGTSVTDLLDATGLEKGGLYHHFGSKDALAIEAFDHSVERIRPRFAAAVRSSRDALARLHALVDAWVGIVDDPPIPGGCPILNTAVDASDTHPRLRARARSAMSELLHDTVERVAERGVERGELRPDADPADVAALVVAAGEGGIMLARLYRDRSHMHRVGSELHHFVDTLAPVVPPLPNPREAS